MPNDFPKFDSLFDYQHKVVELAASSQALATASAGYQMLNAATWWQSWMDYAAETEGVASPVEYIDRGLARANDAIVQFQHSPEFQDAQRDLVKSFAEFRRRHKEVAEIWQEINHAPTQQDIDDLSETVYELRRELRRLRSELNASREETP